jgi:NAD(P)-dependent dehydrogenase (short-subunit alcohol dehydrogenase family)
VTGGARGLGNAFCRAFLRSGCDSIALLDLKQSDADSAAEELVLFAASEGLHDPPKVVGLECDVTSEASVKNAFTRTIETFGRVDVAIAAAGMTENYSALEYPTDRIKYLYDLNVHGVFYTAREAAKYMIPHGGGSIVLVASISADIVNIPQPQTPYNGSKAAVKQMASSLAVEWAKNGVRVNSLSPGYVLTKLTRNILANKPELKKTWEDLTPVGRMADPEDLDGIIVYLASDSSRFMTGSEIRIDGGYCCI